MSGCRPECYNTLYPSSQARTDLARYLLIHSPPCFHAKNWKINPQPYVGAGFVEVIMLMGLYLLVCGGLEFSGNHPTRIGSSSYWREDHFLPLCSCSTGNSSNPSLNRPERLLVWINLTKRSGAVRLLLPFSLLWLSLLVLFFVHEDIPYPGNRMRICDFRCCFYEWKWFSNLRIYSESGSHDLPKCLLFLVLILWLVLIFCCFVTVVWFIWMFRVALWISYIIY
jgi:hypothetical protein